MEKQSSEKQIERLQPLKTKRTTKVVPDLLLSHAQSPNQTKSTQSRLSNQLFSKTRSELYDSFARDYFTYKEYTQRELKESRNVPDFKQPFWYIDPCKNPKQIRIEEPMPAPSGRDQWIHSMGQLLDVLKTST